MSSNNPFIQMWELRKDDSPWLFDDFMEFLEYIKPTLYGIEISPNNLRKINRRLQANNLEIS